MKKILSMLMCLAGFQNAFATSILGTSLDVTRYLKADGRTQHQLSVYVDGTVVDRDYKNLARRERPVFNVVTRLSANQMDQINRLIRRASPEIKRREISGARCFVVAFSRTKHTADNYSVFLKDGDVCDGGWTVNVRPAAKKLVRVLDLLEQAAHNGMNLGELDRQLNQIL